MSMLLCPECNKLVSQFAESCPNCGFPIKKFLDDHNITDPEKFYYVLNVHMDRQCKNFVLILMLNANIVAKS